MLHNFFSRLNPVIIPTKPFLSRNVSVGIRKDNFHLYENYNFLKFAVAANVNLILKRY
jgi:hypothetical protein